jgi:hypothetical protein
MNVDGKCLCGHIAYRATVNPDDVIICHCTDCQNHSATAYGVVVGVVDNQFKLLSGTLKIYTKTASSGRLRALNFCPECGTRIFANAPDDRTAFFGLRLGTITQRAALPPQRQAWCNSALPWVQDLSRITMAD